MSVVSTNQKLALAAGALLVLSALTYWRDTARAERFQRGQKFLQNLDPDEVGQVAVSKGSVTFTLERVQNPQTKDEYRIPERYGYAAKNEAVNRLVRTLLDIELAREAGRGAAALKELEIEPPAENTIEVKLHNRAGQDMVRLRLGKNSEGGSGRFVQRLDQKDAPIYLTTAAPFFDTDLGQYLRKDLVDVQESQIVRIEGPDFVFAKKSDDGATLELEGVAGGKREKSSETSKVKSALNRLVFEEVHVADAAEVANLEWRPALRVLLDDQSGYQAVIAERGGKYYLRLVAVFLVDSIPITREETDEELKEKSEVLKRADEVNKFNAYHGSWVYELTEFLGNKFTLEKADLVEAAT